MKILITAGSTSERIDSVRKITNAATGRLGSLVASEFDRQCGDTLERIFYLCERGSAAPDSARAEIVTAQGVAELKELVTKLMTSEKIDAVVHSMAVSDYTVGSVSTAEALASAIAREIYETIREKNLSLAELNESILSVLVNGDYSLDMSAKISSDLDGLFLHLKKTPKIIGLFKHLQPGTVVVGFKLLSGVPEGELLEAAFRLMCRNSCDFVLANDLDSIAGDKHIGYLVSPDKSFVKYNCKREIAEGIVSAVLGKISGEGRR